SRRRRSGGGDSGGRPSCEKPPSNETPSLETPSSSQSRRTRVSSSASGVTATCCVPAPANTIVLAPEPVSSVAMSALSSLSSHSSAGQARPQYSSPSPWMPGGAARSRFVRLGGMGANVTGSVRELGVHGVVGARRLLPREGCGPLEAPRAPLVGVREDRLDRLDDRLGRGRVEQTRGIAAHLRERRRVRAGDGAPTGHSFERRLAEALVLAREDEARGGAVEVDELLARDVPQGAHAWRRRTLVRGEDELEVRMATAQDGERLEEARVVLVRPGPSGIDEEPLAGDLGRPEHLVVDPEVDRPHAILGDVEAIDDCASSVLRDRDHEGATANRPPVRPAPVCELRAREEVRKELVLEVEYRRD